jgi:Family of unknown function (DUF6090)
MAEDEVAKHSKKIYKIWFDKEHNLWHKVSEFLIEMLIIVFAVSISIWFHNRSEHAHHREDVRIFLQGLKSDLNDDLREMNEDKKSYISQQRVFTYISNLRLNEFPSKDTLKKYRNWLFNTTEFAPNDGRFEGFKSSGKIGYIENDSLQNDIMDLYEEDIPNLLASSKMYVSIKMKLFDLVYKYQKRSTDSTSNYLNFWKLDEVYNISGSLATPDQVIERYGICIRLMEKIIGEIDKETAG